MRLSVITPTILRPTLVNTVNRVAELLQEGDEHIVVIDSLNAPKWEPHQLPRSQFTRYMHIGDPDSVYGNAQRDHAAMNARGEALVWLDDDDLPGRPAYEVLHEVPFDNNTIHIFAMIDNNGGVFSGQNMGIGAIGGPQVVVPNRHLVELDVVYPTWMHNNVREADFHFIQQATQVFTTRRHHPHAIICFVRGTE